MEATGSLRCGLANEASAIRGVHKFLASSFASVKQHALIWTLPADLSKSSSGHDRTALRDGKTLPADPCKQKKQ
eukprot:1157054-Pelagomonas_calceolata.AAC.1